MDNSREQRTFMSVSKDQGPSFHSEHRKSALRQSSKRKLPKAHQYRIILDDEDRTPLSLVPLTYDETQEKLISSSELGDAGKSSRSEKSIAVFGQVMSKFHTELHHQTIMAQSMFQRSYIGTRSTDDDVVIEADIEESEPSVKTYSASIISDALLYEDKRIPSHISLTLNETPTFYILDLPSSSVDKETELGQAVIEDNEQYEYLTVGKGRNRKVINAEVQTQQIILKTQNTEARRSRRKHDYAFASIWDMYDTYINANATEEQTVKTSAIPVTETSSSCDSIRVTAEEKQMEKLMKNRRFQEALIITERLLANNNFNLQQKRFRGLLEPERGKEKVQYNYKLSLLWTFANSYTEGKCVIAMDWNPTNEDVLAVAYGKFYFSNNIAGMVMVWNVKNPVQPERHYSFKPSVTTVKFSQENSNLLAIGFYDGQVQVINISYREKNIICKSRRLDSLNYEPAWHILWYQNEDYNKGEEQLVMTSQDGRIRRYRQTATVDLNCMKIMRAITAEARLKGIEKMRHCRVRGVPIARYTPGLVLTMHPMDPNIYFVATAEGVVHKCSMDYYHQHLDLFMAHDGPIYVMKFSPYCNKLFLTCGDDWTMRIWCEGIPDPLLELVKTMESVQGADWSPNHSTVIASISENDIYIWDIQRKAYQPQSRTQNPTGCKNTVVQFTPSGRCLCIGDTEGNVHIFALEDMPFPAFFQEDLLSQSLRRAMITAPALLKQIKKIGKLNHDKAHYKRHFH